MEYTQIIKNRLLIVPFFLLATSVSYAAGFTLTSPNVRDGENITESFLADDFGCSGKNIQPNFNWNNAPAGTKSFAITLFDKDAKTGSGFWHWIAIDIPASATSVTGHHVPAKAVTKANDTGKKSYLGPCPPVNEVHTYSYTIYALDTTKLESPKDSTAPLTGYFINKHVIEKAVIDLRVFRDK